MIGHHWIPCKIKSRVFTSCFNRPNNGPKFDYWGRKKNILLPSLWSDDMDIESMEVFRNKQLEVTGSCLFRQAEGLAKHWCW